jgi:hypothetical protein
MEFEDLAFWMAAVADWNDAVEEAVEKQGDG